MRTKEEIARGLFDKARTEFVQTREDEFREITVAMSCVCSAVASEISRLEQQIEELKKQYAKSY